MSTATSQTPPTARPVLVAVGPVADGDEALALTVSLQQSGVVVDVRRYEVLGDQLLMLLVPTSREALEDTVRRLAARGKTVTIDGRLVVGSGVGAAPAVSPLPRALRSPHLPVYAVLALLVLAGAAVFLFQPFRGGNAALSSVPGDDAWARFAYARSLADGGRLSLTGGGWDGNAASLLWTALLALGFAVLPFLGPAALGKTLSLASALVLVGASYRLGAVLSGRRWVGLLAGLLVALEPAALFHAVGGTEALLFAALLATAFLAAHGGRSLLAGVLLAAATLTRPEGLLFALLLALGTIAFGDARGRSRRETDLPALAGLPALAALLWGLYGLLADGDAIPALWNTAGDPGGWGALWDSYLSDVVPWWAVGPFALLVLAGSVGALRRTRGTALPAVAFPPALAALYLSIGPGPAGWSHATAHLLAPALPFLLVLAAVGVPVLWAWLPVLRRLPGVRRLPPGGRRAVAPGAMVAVLLLVALSYPAGLVRTMEAYDGWARVVRDLGVAPAEALRDSDEPPGTVASPFPGATAYHVRGGVVSLQGRDIEAAVTAERPAYAVLAAAERWRNEPGADRLAAFATADPPAGLPGEVALYRFRWNPPMDDESIPWGAEPAGLALLDRLDIGDFESEAAHNYSVEGPAPVVDLAGRATGDHAVADEGRVLRRGDSEVFVLPVGTRADLALLTRYDTRYPGRLRVFVDGHRVADWVLAEDEFWFGTARFTIPPLFLLDPKPFIEVRLDVVEAGDEGVRLFHHWLYERP